MPHNAAGMRIEPPVSGADRRGHHARRDGDRRSARRSARDAMRVEVPGFAARPSAGCVPSRRTRTRPCASCRAGSSPPEKAVTDGRGVTSIRVAPALTIRGGLPPPRLRAGRFSAIGRPCSGRAPRNRRRSRGRRRRRACARRRVHVDEGVQLASCAAMRARHASSSTREVSPLEAWWRARRAKAEPGDAGRHRHPVVAKIGAGTLQCAACRTIPISRPPRPGLRHPAAQPHPDGLHAHRARGKDDGFERIAAFYAKRPGARAHGHRRHRPQFRRTIEPKASQLSFLAGVASPPDHGRRARRRRAKIALQILHAGRYAFHPLATWRRRVALADQPVPRAHDQAWGVRKTIADYVRCAELAQRAGYDGVDHGLRGLPHQPVHRAADQPSRRRVGRPVREPHPLPRRDRAPQTREVPDPIHHRLRLSMLDLVEGGSTWDEIVALARPSSRPRVRP